MRNDPQLLLDRIALLDRGMNHAWDPDLIPENQFHDGQNITTRGGRARTRPKIIRRIGLPSGRLQGGYSHEKFNQLLSVIDGKLYQLFPRDVYVNDVQGDILGELDTETPKYKEITGYEISPSMERVWFESVGTLVVIQDGLRQPYIFNGTTVRQAKGHQPAQGDDPEDPDYVPEGQELVIGTAMRFANGRLHIASTAAQNRLYVGDILKGNDYHTALQFTETDYLTGGGYFLFRHPITALREVPVIDNATGQGSMLIGTRKDVYSLHTEVPQRNQWANISNFQSIALPNVGISGPDALVAIHTDIYFRSPDSIRSLRFATMSKHSPGEGGLHREVENRIRNFMTEDTSMVYHDDRLLVLTDPFRSNINTDPEYIYQTGPTLFNGLIALNFDSLNTAGQKSPPAYDGYWRSPVPIRQLVMHDDRCYAFATPAPGVNELWEILPDHEFSNQEDTIQYIDTRILAGGQRKSLKTPHELDLWISDIRTPVEIKVCIRKDNAPGFVPWETITIGRDPITGLPSIPRQNHKEKIQLHSPPEGMTGFQHQLRFAWKGDCQLHEAHFYTKPKHERRFDPNPSLDCEEDSIVYDQTHLQQWT